MSNLWTPEGDLVGLHVEKPNPHFPGVEYYCASVLVESGSLGELEDAVAEVARHKWDQGTEFHWPGKRYVGFMLLHAKCRVPPRTVTLADRRWGRLKIRPFAWEHKRAGRGVSLTLLAVDAPHRELVREHT